LKFSDDALTQIKERLTLSQVIGNYVTLQSAGGSDYKACCPFHHEKTPSFYVHDDKGFYHCFGCGKSGSVFTFIMEMDHLSFPEAVEKLAAEAGVQLREETEGDKKRRGITQQLYEINQRISNTFHYLLMNSPVGEPGRIYLKERGVSAEMCKAFNLGFAPQGGKWLYEFLSKKGYDDELLQETGFFSKNYFPYSIFQNRLMFPIRTWDNKTIAFSGRDLSGTSKAKYINSPETAVFSKKHNLFGLYESVQAIRDKKSIYLCEGNFDVVALHQAGIEEALAPLGTAFTKEQGKLISRYAKQVNLLFDNDDAGINATKKATVLLQQLGLECRVATIEGGKDPSEVLNSLGPESLRNGIQTTVSGFDFLVQAGLMKFDIKEPKGKTNFFAFIKPFLDATDNEIEKDTLLRYTAEILNVDRQSINQQYYATASAPPLSQFDEEQESSDIIVHPLSLDRLSLDLYLMLTVVNNRELYPQLRSLLGAEELRDSEAKEVYAVLENVSREMEGKNDEFILQYCQDMQLLSDVRTSFTLPDFHRDNSLGVMNELIERIRLRNLEEQRASVVRLISLSAGDDQVAGQEDLIGEKMDMDREIVEIKKRLANVDPLKKLP